MAGVGTPTLLTSQPDESHGLKSCRDHQDGEWTAVREETATEDITQENLLSVKMGWWQMKMVSTAGGRTRL